MASPPSLNKKLFGCCKVKWQIENCSLQMFKKKWIIQSPEFTINGFEETNWCMSLRIYSTNKNNCVLFGIKRCAIDSGSKYVKLNLEISCMFSDEKSICLDDKLVSLKNGSKYEVCLGSMQYLQTDMNRSDDCFSILCHMIVYSDKKNQKFGECQDEGLKLLSKNMLDLYRSTENFDIKLMFDDNIILAHRAILYARNEFLGSLIYDDDDLDLDEFEECQSLDFTDMLDYNGMKKILGYLYTGDLRHVLEEPSFALDYCASFLDICEIEDCYEPDHLVIRSSVDIEEYNYTLRGYEFGSGCLNWNIHVEGSMRTYRLAFYPKRYAEDYIPLFIKTYDRPMIARHKLDFFDDKGNLYFTNSIILDGEFLDIDERVRHVIRKIYSSNGIFEVIINLQLTAGKTISKVDESSSYFVSFINEDVHYETLSEDLECLLDGPFNDTIIDNNGTYFWVHKCVLASRSQLFSNLIKTKEDGEVIVLSTLDPHTISLVLTYIYSGLLLDADDGDVIEVYKAAVLSNLPQLKSVCSDWLKRSFKTSSGIRCRVVKIAEVYEDITLKKYVLSLLFDKRDSFLTLNNEISIPDAHACRYCLSPL